MTQEDKNLLLKDLCSRLPYGVKCRYQHIQYVENDTITDINMFGRVNINGHIKDICDIKPYLYPLSSMDEELKKFLKWKLTTPWHDSFDEDSIEDILKSNIQVVHFCYEHNLDINGLIPKGLAEDATGKNIY